MNAPVLTPSTALRWATLALSGLLLMGCAGMNNTEQRVLTGAAIGAGAGAGLGAVTGGLSIPAGAIIGAGAGAVTGLAVDAMKAGE
jgi:hypothetical protein